MEYAITVFILGLMVTALVAKGLFAAQDLAEESQRQDEEKRQATLEEKRQATFPN